MNAILVIVQLLNGDLRAFTSRREMYDAMPQGRFRAVWTNTDGLWDVYETRGAFTARWDVEEEAVPENVRAYFSMFGGRRAVTIWR